MKKAHVVKSTLGALALLACAEVSRGAGFAPITINPASFNRDPVVEASAPTTLNNVINATMDGGTNKSGNTFFERGFNATNLATGLPLAGSTFVGDAGAGNH